MNAMHTLELNHVSKHIRRKEILRDVSCRMESGKITGFRGENGSGKTMIFRTIAGLIYPDSGEILYDGKKLWKETEPVMGITIENAALFPELTGKENLLSLVSIRKRTSEKEVTEAIRRVGLDPDDHRFFREYSLGMKQRLLIAQAIMEDPDILALDEPTNGLDPDGRELVIGIIRDMAKKGKIVLLSTHIKEDMDQICDRIYLVADHTVTEENRKKQ